MQHPGQGNFFHIEHKKDHIYYSVKPFTFRIK